MEKDSKIIENVRTHVRYESREHPFESLGGQEWGEPETDEGKLGFELSVRRLGEAILVQNQLKWWWRVTQTQNIVLIDKMLIKLVP